MNKDGVHPVSFKPKIFPYYDSRSFSEGKVRHPPNTQTDSSPTTAKRLIIMPAVKPFGQKVSS